MPEVEFTFSCPGCCGDGAGWEVQCRTRAGTATLCGHVAFTSPSVPPRLYKTRTIAGASRQITHDALDCGGSVIGTLEYVYSGTCSYNPAAGCSLVQNGKYERLFNGAVTDSGPTCSINTLQCGATAVLTPTSKTFVPDNPCSNGSGFSNECVASASETLSNEDTEEDAMSRVPAVWSEWASGFCCTAKTTRGPGEYSFNFSESEYRIRVKGAPGQVITLYLWFTETGIDGEFYEVWQFVAQGPEFGEWSPSVPIAASAGKTCCLTRITRYVS